MHIISRRIITIWVFLLISLPIFSQFDILAPCTPLPGIDSVWNSKKLVLIGEHHNLYENIGMQTDLVHYSDQKGFHFLIERGPASIYLINAYLNSEEKDLPKILEHYMAADPYDCEFFYQLKHKTEVKKVYAIDYDLDVRSFMVFFIYAAQKGNIEMDSTFTGALEKAYEKPIPDYEYIHYLLEKVFREMENKTILVTGNTDFTKQLDLIKTSWKWYIHYSPTILQFNKSFIVREDYLYERIKTIIQEDEKQTGKFLCVAGAFHTIKKVQGFKEMHKNFTMRLLSNKILKPADIFSCFIYYDMEWMRSFFYSKMKIYTYPFCPDGKWKGTQSIYTNIFRIQNKYVDGIILNKQPSYREMSEYLFEGY